MHGSLQLRELNRVLRRGNDFSSDSAKVDITVNISSRRNWSRRKVDDVLMSTDEPDEH